MLFVCHEAETGYPNTFSKLARITRTSTIFPLRPGKPDTKGSLTIKPRELPTAKRHTAQQPTRGDGTPLGGRGTGTTGHPGGDEGREGPEGKASGPPCGDGAGGKRDGGTTHLALGGRGAREGDRHTDPVFPRPGPAAGWARRAAGRGRPPPPGRVAARRGPLPTVDLQASQKVSSVKRSMRLVLPTPRDPMMITCSLKSAGRGGCFLRRD